MPVKGLGKEEMEAGDYSKKGKPQECVEVDLEQIKTKAYEHGFEAGFQKAEEK